MYAEPLAERLAALCWLAGQSRPPCPHHGKIDAASLRSRKALPAFRREPSTSVSKQSLLQQKLGLGTDCGVVRKRSDWVFKIGRAFMKYVVMAAIGLFAPMALMAVPAHSQAVRSYDCAKAGNANKAVCKSAAAAAKPAPRVAAPRNYDCSKAGNANKAMCKTAMPAARQTPANVSTATITRHYDCTKSGNATKSACKGMAPSVTPPAPPVPATTTTHSRTVAQSRTTTTTSGAGTSVGGPNRATAKCRDGSMSFSAHRSGTCSRHGGVAQFY